MIRYFASRWTMREKRQSYSAMGVFGAKPSETADVTASYRVGGGSTGNIGPDTLVLARATAPVPWLDSVTNPLPATGGRDWESHDHARRIAPSSFHQPIVAVTAADYQEAAASFTDASGARAIQRANATFLWTGSWLTVTLTVDPWVGEGLTADLQEQLTRFLNSRRLSGYDIQISGPIYVPVDLALQISVLPGFQRSDVEQALLQAFSSGTLADGSNGFFHPDNFTFGDNSIREQDLRRGGGGFRSAVGDDNPDGARTCCAARDGNNRQSGAGFSCGGDGPGDSTRQ